MVDLVELIDPGKSSDLLELVSSVSNAKQRRRRPRTRKRDPKHVPRPTNCFMIYRLEMQKYIRTYCPNANHREISKIVAKWWHKEPLHVKEHFRAMADKAKQEHKDMYPEYKYVPKKKKKQQQQQSNPIKSQELQSLRTSSPPTCTSASDPSSTHTAIDLEMDSKFVLAPHSDAVRPALSCTVSHQQPDNDPDYTLYSDHPPNFVDSQSTDHYHGHSLLPATDDIFNAIPLVYYGASASTSPMATPVWDSLSCGDPIASYGSLLDHTHHASHWQPPHRHQLVLSTRPALSSTHVPSPHAPPSLVEPLPYNYGYYPTYF
ncbi:hypothetical protein BX666DRAFT_542356 [Dichotomocladium elegans]|nr:hypothetical protein BX666DRAFT_542356 [Dichotomocladium elegans]